MAPQLAHADSEHTASEDWEALWLLANGPRVPAQDLNFMGELFGRLDRDGDGVVRAPDLRALRAALAAAAEASGGDVVEEDVDGELDSAFGDLDPAGWAALHAAALSAYGLSAWRRGLAAAAAVCRVTRAATEPVEEEPWTVYVGPGGDIVSAWFSQGELRPEEKQACRALVNAEGWRCLSCESEALEPQAPIGPPPPGLMRAISAEPASPLGGFLPPLEQPLALKKAITHQVGASYPCTPRVSEFARSASARFGPRPRGVQRGESSPKPGLSWRSSLWRCQSLRQMLSHRALWPVRKPTRVGDRVVIENVSKGTAKKSDLGLPGRVTHVWVPEQEVVKQEWCKVQLTDTEPPYEVLVPVTNVVDIRVPLRPGDRVEAYRPVESGRYRGERSALAYDATVLGMDEKHPLKVEVSFGEDDTMRLRMSWIRRVEMSAWTQVLRRAPYSTVMFLLFDLCLTPETPEDVKELEDRIRRDFTPHGRVRYVGPGGAWQDEGVCADEADLSPARRRKCTDYSPTRSRLGLGDRGKILSFDLQTLHVEMLPDRKKHLKLRVCLDSLVPDPSLLERVAVSGQTAMHKFAEDPPILAAIKNNDTKTLRLLIREVSGLMMPKVLLEDNVDADGNNPFHAAVYERNEEALKIVHTALFASAASTDEHMRAAVGAVNDWGQSPFWVALESGNVGLCRLLLKSNARVDQESPVLSPGEDHRATAYEFCGGPGLVASGVQFEVTLYTPEATSGLRFGSGSPGDTNKRFVVVRTFGEPAEACVMPGDILLAVDSLPASSFASFKQLEHRLGAAKRPLVLQFLKGKGLFIQPLHRACELGNDQVVKLLLEFNADPCWCDACGRSAMDRAVRRRNRKPEAERAPYDRCVALLAEAGGTQEGRVTVFDQNCNQAVPFRPPAHWRSCPEMRAEGRFWLRVEEVTSKKVLGHLQHVLDRSVGSTAFKKPSTKDRRGKVPVKLIIEHVQRVENVASLVEYLQRRSVLRRAVGPGPIHQVTDSLKVKVSYEELAEADVASPLDDKLNEVFLFHGTSPAGAGGIALDDFQLSMAGSNGGDAFGRGIYFAEDCMKCDEYTKEAPHGHKYAGLRPVLLCRVLLGRPAISEERDVSYEIDAIMRRKCDSLIADRKAAVGTYREFIVFDADQTNAEYILWYRRYF